MSNNNPEFDTMAAIAELADYLCKLVVVQTEGGVDSLRYNNGSLEYHVCFPSPKDIMRPVVSQPNRPEHMIVMNMPFGKTVVFISDHVSVCISEATQFLNDQAKSIKNEE